MACWSNEQIQRAREQFNKAQVSEETQRDAINKIKQEAIGVGIENILKEAQVGKTRTETNAIIEGVKQKKMAGYRLFVLTKDYAM